MSFILYPVFDPIRVTIQQNSFLTMDLKLLIDHRDKKAKKGRNKVYNYHVTKCTCTRNEKRTKRLGYYYLEQKLP